MNNLRGELVQHPPMNQLAGGGLVTESCPTLGDPMDCSAQPAPAPLSQGFPHKTTGFTGDIPNPGIDPWSPGLQADFFFF